MILSIRITSPLEVRKTPWGSTPRQGSYHTEYSYHTDCMFDTLLTLCKSSITVYIRMGYFLEAKSGVLKIKWFLKK